MATVFHFQNEIPLPGSNNETIHFGLRILTQNQVDATGLILISFLTEEIIISGWW